jgi:predicted NBD/HSP70 family sugar kinase
MDIHKLTHFRPSTISLLVRELINEGQLREAGLSDNPIGRKQILLTINEGYGILLGLEFDAELVKAAAMDLRPRILGLVHERANLSGGAEGLVRQLIGISRNAIKKAGNAAKCLLGIAVADPGLIDSAKGISVTCSVLDFWKNIPLRKIFEKEFGVPLLLESNTRAQTIAERILGAGEHAEDMVYIDYGTGIGSGIFAEGHLLRGHCETAGEFGHTHVMADGPPCKCGSFGCLEAIASAPALAAKARKAVMEGSSSHVSSLAGDPSAISGWHVLESAKAGDKMCSALVEDMGNYLGLGIANLVNLFNPSVVVLGRKLELAGTSLLEQIARIVKRQALPHATADIAFRFGKLGDEAGILGAGLLVLEKLFEIPALKPPRFLTKPPSPFELDTGNSSPRRSSGGKRRKYRNRKKD